MSWLQLDPKSIADRATAVNDSPSIPSTAGSVVRGAMGFTVVSVAGFAPWALAGSELHRAVGEIGLYAICALVFIGLSGLLLHRLIIGPGSLERFYLLFSVAFGAYAVAWTVGWMSLRGNLGSVVGLLLGTGLMGWILVRAFDARAVLVKMVVELFVCNAFGYFAGGWVEARVAGLGIIHLFTVTLDRHAILASAMLMWGVCYGVGFGVGLGLAFHLCQAKARAILTGS